MSYIPCPSVTEKKSNEQDENKVMEIYNLNQTGQSKMKNKNPRWQNKNPR